MASNPILARPDALDSHCPWCEQAIPHEKFDAIHTRIQAKERERLSEEERRMREQLQQQKAEFEAKARAEIEAAHKQARETQTRSKEQVDAAQRLAQEEIAKAKASAEAAARADVEAQKKATSEAIERMRLESEEKARLALEDEKRRAAETLAKAEVDFNAARKAADEAHAQARAQLEQDRGRVTEAMAKAKAETDAAAKAYAEAHSLVEAQKASAADEMQKLRAEAAAREVVAREEAAKMMEAQLAARVAAAEQMAAEFAQKAQAIQVTQASELVAQRTALEKDAVERVNIERAKAFETASKLQQEVEALNRKVQQQSAQELGEGAEIDLFEQLKGEFPDDLFARVGKGAPGADIRHVVRHNGQVCGTVLYESKNRDQWRYDYAKKLREDQLSDKADHAILSTNQFPAGRKQLHIHEGVILACPARVLEVVRILREHILRAHTLRLSGTARAQKTAELYEFMTSDRSTNLFNQMITVAEQLEDLDAKEFKAHKATWEKRGQLIRSTQKAQANLQTEIERILGTGPVAGSGE